MAKTPKPVNLEDLSSLILQHHFTSLSTLLARWSSMNAVAPVLLLTGPAGIGKETLGKKLAQWIFCTEKGLRSSQPSSDLRELCHSCPSCRSIETGTDVRIHEIRSEAAEGESGSSPKSGNLKIDQFRKLKEGMGFGTPDGISKAVLIHDADRMTLQASNSVLKLLEEPPKGWVFFLTTRDTSLLPQTLLSRSQMIRLKPFPDPMLEDILLKLEIPSDRARECVALAEGSLTRALHFSSDENWEARQTVLHFLEEPHKYLQTLLDWASAAPEHFETLTDILEQAAIQSLLKITDQTKSDRFHFWISQSELISRVREKAHAPTNRKLLIQELLLPWLGVQQ